MRHKRRPHAPISLLLLLLAALACGPSLPPPPTRTPVPSSLPANPTATSTQTLVPASTINPIPCRFNPTDTITTSELLADVILFVQGTHNPTGNYVPQLWAVSPDGQRLGTLTADSEGIAAHVPANPPPDLLIASITPLAIDSDRFQSVVLPPDCKPPAVQKADWLPCSDFRFSPNGKYLGFLWGRDQFARKGITVIEPSSGRTWTWNLGNVYRFSFLTNERVLALSGHPEGGGFSLWNIETGEERGLGGAGEMVPNADGSALAWTGGPYGGWESTVWIYNIASDQHFASEGGLDEGLLWTPDSTHLLYQHRVLTYTEQAYSFTIGPREIRIIDIASGEDRPLIGGLQNSYHLCDGPRACQWRGDWILVRRVPFQPQVYVGSWGDIDFRSPEIQCSWYGLDCADSVEQLALNWQTGEWLPWDKAALPPLMPTSPPPTPWPTPGPDLSGTPLYREPDGLYALYTGAGTRDLWCVPTIGKPVQWIHQGYYFIYVP
jgi:hypothetical protein